ncbi:MAG: type II secretion system protein [Planctomycetota bacterium]
MQVNMVSGFTLIELMIIISIMAMVGAVAVPTIRERRLMANEAHVASVLRNSIHPAMELFRSGGFSDWDEDGCGEYAGDIGYLAGRTVPQPRTYGETPFAFYALPRPYAAGDAHAVVHGYRFAISLARDSDQAVDCAERYYGVFARPDSWQVDGRRAFGMLQDGVIYMSAAEVAGERLWSRADLRDLFEPGTSTCLFANDYVVESGRPNSELTTLTE